MNWDGANECDVREELATPLLSALGYARGTANDILREYALSYGRFFLGRKKKDDPPLRGRANYILSVLGAARWTLEIKAPSQDIDRDAIDQALSYALHPEIAASYAAILNGKRFVLFHISQSSKDVPLLEIDIVDVGSLSESLQGTLSPGAIRRDCSPPKVDLGVPLADGLRSSVDVRKGLLSYTEFGWDCNFPLDSEGQKNLNDTSEKMKSFRPTITGGKIFRDENSRVVAKFDWAFPHDELLKFAHDKHLLDMEYISLSSTISKDASSPTIFDVVGRVDVTKGDAVFSLFQWQTQTAGIDMLMNYRGQAAGCIDGERFCGNFQVEYCSTFPAIPACQLTMFGIGTFEVLIDTR